jgi:hypothetical protein
MKLSFNFSDIFSKAKQNVSVVLLAVLVVLLLMEAWTMKGSWGVLAASKDATLIIPPKLVRINFTTYDAILKRLDNASAYDPKPFVDRNPFGVHEKETVTTGAPNTP